MGGLWVPVLIGSVEFLFGIRLFLLVEAPSFIMCFIISGLLNLIAMLRMVNLKDRGLLTVLALPEWNGRMGEKLRPADWAVMANVVTTLKVCWRD